MICRLNLFIVFPIFLFVAAAPAPASSNPDDKTDEQAGAILYRDKGCVQCHAADGSGTKKGPSLVDIRNDKEWPPEKIARQIRDGGQKMPPFADSLTDPEIAQLVAYLRAKDKPTPPPAPPAN